MQLDEFEGLLVHLEPSITKKVVLKLFKEAASLADDDNVDSISPEILMRQILQYKIGGYGKEFFSTYLSKRKAKFKDKQHKKKPGK